jgi:hypothetical protein
MGIAVEIEHKRVTPDVEHMNDFMRHELRDTEHLRKDIVK